MLAADDGAAGTRQDKSSKKNSSRHVAGKEVRDWGIEEILAGLILEDASYQALVDKFHSGEITFDEWKKTVETQWPYDYCLEQAQHQGYPTIDYDFILDLLEADLEDDQGFNAPEAAHGTQLKPHTEVPEGPVSFGDKDKDFLRSLGIVGRAKSAGRHAKIAAPDVFRLSREFSRQLIKAVEESHPGKTQELVRLTMAEDDPNICHSHDYCDANTVMLDAFKTVVGRDLCTPSEVEEGSCDVATQEADLEMASSAWDLAKKNLFYLKDEEDMANRPPEPPKPYSDEDKETLKSRGVKGRLAAKELKDVPVATKGPTADKGDTFENALEYLEENAEELEGGTVADAMKLLEGGEYSREVISKVIAEVYGPLAETTLSAPASEPAEEKKEKKDADEPTVVEVPARTPAVNIVINVTAKKKVAGAYSAEWTVPYSKAPDEAALQRWWAEMLKHPDARGDKHGYGGLPPRLKVSPEEVQTRNEARVLVKDKAEKWDFAYAVRCKEKEAWIVGAWIPE
jgi:hypothetical protein